MWTVRRKSAKAALESKHHAHCASKARQVINAADAPLKDDDDERWRAVYLLGRCEHALGNVDEATRVMEEFLHHADTITPEEYQGAIEDPRRRHDV